MFCFDSTQREWVQLHGEYRIWIIVRSWNFEHLKNNFSIIWSSILRYPSTQSSDSGHTTKWTNSEVKVPPYLSSRHDYEIANSPRRHVPTQPAAQNVISCDRTKREAHSATPEMQTMTKHVLGPLPKSEILDGRVSPHLDRRIPGRREELVVGPKHLTDGVIMTHQRVLSPSIWDGIEITRRQERAGEREPQKFNVHKLDIKRTLHTHYCPRRSTPPFDRQPASGRMTRPERHSWEASIPVSCYFHEHFACLKSFF